MPAWRGVEPVLGCTRGLFAPRFGFAYHVHPKVVLRGGFGLFPLEEAINPRLTSQSFAIQTGFSQTTSLVPTLDNGLSFVANLASRSRMESYLPRVVAGSGDVLGSGHQLLQSGVPDAVSMQWNFNIQTMLPGQFLLEVGYTGTHSISFRCNGHERDTEPIPERIARAGPEHDQLSDRTSPQSVRGHARTSLGSATVARSQLLLPFPQFRSVTMNDYQGFSRYNALQVRLERRFSKGFTLMGGYTFSKNISAENYYFWGSAAYLNAGDPVPTRAIAGIDQTHMFTMTGMWELPFGKGKPFLGSIGRLGDAFVGGWQFSGVETVHSGVPLGFGNVLYTGNIKDIAIHGGQPPEHWFNTAGFVTAPVTAIGEQPAHVPRPALKCAHRPLQLPGRLAPQEHLHSRAAPLPVPPRSVQCIQSPNRFHRRGDRSYQQRVRPGDGHVLARQAVADGDQVPVLTRERGGSAPWLPPRFTPRRSVCKTPGGRAPEDRIRTAPALCPIRRREESAFRTSRTPPSNPGVRFPALY